MSRDRTSFGTTLLEPLNHSCNKINFIQVWIVFWRSLGVQQDAWNGIFYTSNFGCIEIHPMTLNLYVCVPVCCLCYVSVDSMMTVNCHGYDVDNINFFMCILKLNNITCKISLSQIIINFYFVLQRFEHDKCKSYLMTFLKIYGTKITT